MDDIVRAKVARYVMLREDMALIKQSMEDVKAELKPYLAQGRENAKGSKVLDFKEPLTVGGKVYPGVQNTRKVKRTLNEERVLEWLSAKQNSEAEDDVGWDDIVSNTGVIKYVQHVDFDVLWDLHVQNLITEEELDSFFDEDVTWAFTPISE